MHEISIKAEEIFRVGDFPVTNALLLSFLTLVVLISLTFFLWRKISIIPSKFQSIVELSLEALLKLMDSILGERRLSEKYLPIVATIFAFILFSNWLGLFPFVGPLQIENAHDTPIFRAPASDLNFTLVMSIIAVFSAHLFGALALGVRKHFSKFFTFKNPIFTFAGILEFIAEFIKIISFAFRLFGNVFAGEVLLIIVGFLAPYFLPLPFLFLEIFVGFIQAFIFSMLMLVFISMNVKEHEP